MTPDDDQFTPPRPENTGPWGDLERHAAENGSLEGYDLSEPESVDQMLDALDRCRAYAHTIGKWYDEAEAALARRRADAIAAHQRLGDMIESALGAHHQHLLKATNGTAKRIDHERGSLTSRKGATVVTVDDEAELLDWLINARWEDKLPGVVVRPPTPDPKISKADLKAAIADLDYVTVTDDGTVGITRDDGDWFVMPGVRFVTKPTTFKVVTDHEAS